MHVPLVQAICCALTEVGIAALRFNFRGVGASGGTFDNGRGEVDDVAGALNWLGAQLIAAPDRLALVGYSFGAAMAMFEAVRNDRPQALGLIGPPLGWDLPLATDGDRPHLLVAGERDQFCSASDLERMARQLKGDVEMHIVANADHFLFGYEGEVADVVAEFMRVYL
jgi:alpha/beta superfamily hydrolase